MSTGYFLLDIIDNYTLTLHKYIMQDNILTQVKTIIRTSKPDGVVTQLRYNITVWPHILEYTASFEFKNKSEQVYFYAEQLSAKPICKCGVPLTFVSIVSGYREFCSRSCSYAKTAALERRVAVMKKNGGVGLANPKTYLKAKITLRKTYGVEVFNPGQLKSHKLAMVNSNPMKLDENKQKLKKVFEKKYGKNRTNPGLINCTDYQIELLSDIDKFAAVVKGKNAVTVANETGLNHSTIMRRAHTLNLLNTMIYKPKSAMEDDLAQWLDSQNITYQQHNRSILPNNLELDFYFPQWNFAIELHGIFHHSELGGNKDKQYHIHKYSGCALKNIQLLQIWQDEYWSHKAVVQSKILYLANLITNKIHARKCTVSTITDVISERDFLNINHIQGFADYRQQSMGAWYNKRLVGVMSFARQQNRLELVRYATDINSVAVGLFSKMLAASIAHWQFTGDIVSLSDNRISNGKLYMNNGWTFVSEQPPGYCYTTDYATRLNRQHCMKSKLIKRHLLDPAISTVMTEWEIAQQLGYDRLWDSGKRKWIFTI